MDLQKKYFQHKMKMKDQTLIDTNVSSLPKDRRQMKSTSDDIALVNAPNDITAVTAYFYLGSFKKDWFWNNYGSNTYQRWFQVFKYIHNPLVVYTDTEYFHALVTSVRTDALANKTQIILIDRNTSWAFQFEKRIADVFSDKNYPKYHPNTVVPGYACAQHAKYDVTSRAAKANYFGTQFFAWLDVGYFRNKVASTKNFKLIKPKEFNDSKLAMNLINYQKMSMRPYVIVRKNIVWVGGGLFLGHLNVILKTEKQYKRAVNYLLSQGIMNTDEQVIFAIYSDEGKRIIKPEVDLQIYRSARSKDWFYLGEEMVLLLD